jgi:putative Mn2+ efflux pump MntP
VSYLQIVLLSVGLAMDAMAVAAARGFASTHIRIRDVLLPALLFGAAQALMPALGWAIGQKLGRWVAAFDHWFAFIILGALGAKMLHEALGSGPQVERTPAGLSTLLALALATSVDAFAVGLTLPLLDAPFALSIVTIGLVTALLSACGVVLGRRFGALFGRRLDAFGGVVLILLGCKILFEHLRQ